jgi:hypothetical protein
LRRFKINDDVDLPQEIDEIEVEIETINHIKGLSTL